MSQVTKRMLRGKITSFKMKNLIPNFLPKITKPLLLSNTPQLQVCANNTLSSFCHPFVARLFPPTRTPCRARRGQRRHAPPPQPVAAQHGDGQFQSGHCTLGFFDVLHANECRYHRASLSHGSSSCTRPERCFGHLSGEF